MMLILNRLRGTYGWFAKVVGVVLGLLTYLVWHDVYVALMVAIGYVAGESFGWGEWIGNLTTNRKNKTDTLEDEGENNGIKYIATKLVPNWNVAFIKYCRVALGIRGIYWWLPTLAPLYFVGFSVELLTLMILALSVGFPIACELGYYFRDKVSFEKFGLSYSGGWELQEGFYGLMQDLVLIGGICYVMV